MKLVTSLNKTILPLSLLTVSSAGAALPTPFYECLQQRSGSPLGAADMKELVKVTPVTYCANQSSAFNKNEMKNLLSSGGNFQLAVHLANTNYTASDLRENAPQAERFIGL